MSSADKRLTNDAVRHLKRSLLLSAAACAVTDLIVALLFRGSLLSWIILILSEVAVVTGLLLLRRQSLSETLRPLDSLVHSAAANKNASLQRSELRRISRHLEQVDAGSLDAQVSASGADYGVEALAGSINGMLERIDRGYQAQVRFTSDASHELRTPIAVIQGYADLLDRWGKDDPQIMQEAIDAIKVEADSMAILINQLLYLVRGDKGTQPIEMDPVDLTALVTSIARETAMVAPNYTIVPEVDTGITAVADVEAIKECIRILTDNAVKYTPDAGTITLRLSRAGEEVRVAVTDTGLGISEEDQLHIFERFFRADNSRSRQTGGTGLGLSIAIWIAQRHHGRIEVQSKLGEGSTFTLVLPVEQPVEEIETPSKEG